MDSRPAILLSVSVWKSQVRWTCGLFRDKRKKFSKATSDEFGKCCGWKPDWILFSRRLGIVASSLSCYSVLVPGVFQALLTPIPQRVTRSPSSRVVCACSRQRTLALDLVLAFSWGVCASWTHDESPKILETCIVLCCEMPCSRLRVSLQPRRTLVSLSLTCAMGKSCHVPIQTRVQCSEQNCANPVKES